MLGSYPARNSLAHKNAASFRELSNSSSTFVVLGGDSASGFGAQALSPFGLVPYETSVLHRNSPAFSDHLSSSTAGPSVCPSVFFESAFAESRPSPAPRVVRLLSNSPLVPGTQFGDVIDLSFDADTARKKRLSALRRSVWVCGTLHELHSSVSVGRLQPWMVTLTYAETDSWTKRDISRAVKKYRVWCRRRGYECRYVWVAELQGRGAVHYHLIVWLPAGVECPFFDCTTPLHAEESPAHLKYLALCEKNELLGLPQPLPKVVAPFWPHGCTNSEVARTGVGYLMKYVSKLEDVHDFPAGLRLYGSGGFSEFERTHRAWYSLPSWVKNVCGVGDVKRTPLGFVLTATNEVLEPLYERHMYPGGCILRIVRAAPERFHDNCYSTFPRVLPAVDKDKLPGAWCAWPRQRDLFPVVDVYPPPVFKPGRVVDDVHSPDFLERQSRDFALKRLLHEEIEVKCAAIRAARYAEGLARDVAAAERSFLPKEPLRTGDFHVTFRAPPASPALPQKPFKGRLSRLQRSASPSPARGGAAP